MTDFAQAAHLANAIILPLIGLWALLHLKLSVGEAERRSQTQFFAILIVMSFVTLRTVSACDNCWLIHTSTTAAMILGALVMPSRSEAGEAAAAM